MEYESSLLVFISYLYHTFLLTNILRKGGGKKVVSFPYELFFVFDTILKHKIVLY